MWNTKSILKNLKIKKLFKDGKINIVKDDKFYDRMNILIDVALRNNYTILVGNQTKIYEYKEMSNEEVEVVGFALNFTKHLRSRDVENGVLIDESIAPEMLRHLRKEFPEIVIRGGFQK